MYTKLQLGVHIGQVDFRTLNSLGMVAEVNAKNFHYSSRLPNFMTSNIQLHILYGHLAPTIPHGVNSLTGPFENLMRFDDFVKLLVKIFHHCILASNIALDFCFIVE